MSVQTCDVICSLIDQSGNPIDGARITARLMGSMLGTSLMLADVEDGLTNGHGQCTLVLSPSIQKTSYTIEILLPGSRPKYFKGIVIPEKSSITLAELLGWSQSSVTLKQLQLSGGEILINGLTISFSDAVTPTESSKNTQINGFPILISGVPVVFSNRNRLFMLGSSPLLINGQSISFS